MPHRLARLAAAALLISTITACGSGDGPDYIWLRAFHAMPDTPALRMSVDQYVFRREVAFGAATPESGESLLSGAGPTARMDAWYLLPGGEQVNLFDIAIPVEKDSSSTVIFAGRLDAPETIVVVTPRLPRPLAAQYTQFAHAALESGAVDVYVTAMDTDLTATAPLVTLQPRAHSEILQIPFGETRIRITPTGSLEVLLDTGRLDFQANTASTGPGEQWLFAISPSNLPGPSPLLLAGSNGRQNFRFLDVGTPATVRAVHAALGTPTADVLIPAVAAEGEQEATPEVLLYSGLEYGQRAPLVPAPIGVSALQFRDAAPDGEPFATTLPLALLAGVEYAAFLVGLPDEPLIVVNTSSTQGLASESRIRLANLAPDSKFFSVYLTATADEETGDANRLWNDLRYATVTPHLRRVPGDYFVIFTERFYATPEEAATAVETVVFGPTPLELLGGDVLTFAIFPPANEGETEVLQVFDDRMP